MTRRRRVRGVALALALGAVSVAAPVGAQVFGQSARTQFITGFGLRVFTSYAELGSLRASGSAVDDPLRRRIRVRTSPIGLVYGLRPALSLEAIVPFVERELTLDGPGGRVTLGGGYGLGDALFLAKWRFFKVDRTKGTFQLAAEVGVKAPTGQHRLSDREGNRLPPMLQRGSGSWDPILNLQLTSVPVAGRGRWVLTGDLGHTWSTESDGFELGDRFVYDAAVRYRIHPTHYPGRDTFLVLEVNGRSRQRSRRLGEAVADSGGDLLFVAPGIQFLLRQNLILEGGVQIPVLRRLNGTQLGPDFTALLGFRYIVVP